MSQRMNYHAASPARMKALSRQYLRRAGKGGTRVGRSRNTSRRPLVSDSAFEAVVAVFGENQLADLTITISLLNACNRMAISFRATPLALTYGRPEHPHTLTASRSE